MSNNVTTRPTIRRAPAPDVAQEVNASVFQSEQEMFGLLENAPTNIMYCGTDLIIKYINPASRDTLSKIEEHLPISVSEVVGSSIDVFHKNPSHQKKILANARNLPMKSIIDVGPEKLDLLVSPIYDSDRKYIGAMVTWDVVTKKLEAENEAARLQALVENAPINIMCANKDGVITYLNPESINTLKSIEKELPIKVDQIKGGSFDVFHKNPSMQRNLIADERNLPHRAIIQVGKNKLSLLVSPMKDASGKYVGPMVTWEVVTEKLKMEQLNEDYANLNAALSKTQASIEFKVDGTIVTANENFQKALGYTLEEIKGKHHSMFCDPAWVNSSKYKDFWFKLGSGQFDQGQYKRITKDGREIWIQASYNPVFDSSGKVAKVVKYATDITREKKQAMDLVRTLGETADQLGAAAEELSATATQMSKNSEQTSNESQNASAASEQVSKGVQTVATNTEEMAASIKEIAKSSSDAADISKDTMQRATETNVMINQLGVSSEEIGNVIKVISSIAQQTNLLALNATIEAARAGEAGKGFAVVANEVKELAKQTAKATDEITSKINAIQGDSKKAVESIGGIAKVIEKLNGISVSIAAAVEEQTATTNEVSRVVQESSKGVSDIAQTVKVVADAAQQSSAGATQTLAAAKSLANLASQLKELVRKIEV